MKRFLATTLCVFAILGLLSGCGANESAARRFREKVASASEIDITADVSADYGGRVVRYRLRYTESDGQGSVEVLEPELIAGIKARVSDRTASLEFDGVILESGKLDIDGLTPVSALPAIVNSMRTGHIAATGRERDLLILDITVSENSRQQLRLDAETLTPIRAEIRSGDVMYVFCEIISVSMT